MGMQVRKVNGFVLTKSIDPATIRMVNGYVMVDQVTRPNFGLTGLEGLLIAINKEKNVSLVASNLIFGNPVQIADTTQFLNTDIVVTAKASMGYAGSYTFNYHRFDLAEGFDGQTLSLPSSVGSTIWATLAAINTKFGVKLETRDVLDGPIAGGATSITLTASSTSVYYRTGTTVTLGS